MICVIQRVSSASIEVNARNISAIDKGYLILLGICENDGSDDVEYLSSKISSIRLFNDSMEKINLSIRDIGGDVMLVSQFTLCASTQKGNRPSFTRALERQKARELYGLMIVSLEKKVGKKIFTGEFGAHMNVALVNDGPVTILLDSRNRE